MTRASALLLLAVAACFAGVTAQAAPDDGRAMTVFATIQGDPVYTVLPPDAIPAIRDPSFLEGEAARQAMRDDEPVLAVRIGGHARAYSLWHLDAHEIVNDEVEGKTFAVTW